MKILNEKFTNEVHEMSQGSNLKHELTVRHDMKSKQELLEELDNPDFINTYKKIMKCAKKSLQEFIDNPNSDTWCNARMDLGSYPYLFADKEDELDDWENPTENHNYYEVANDHIGQLRDRLHVLADLFMEYYEEFIKEGASADKMVREHINAMEE